MIHTWGNVVEGILWIAIAVVIYARTGQGAPAPRKRVAMQAALAFFWFGISDFIEVTTGVWYRPLPLLGLKAACVGVLLHCLLRWRRLQPQPKSTE